MRTPKEAFVNGLLCLSYHKVGTLNLTRIKAAKGIYRNIFYIVKYLDKLYFIMVFTFLKDILYNINLEGYYGIEDYHPHCG